MVVHNCQMHADLKRMFIRHQCFDVTRAFGENASSDEVYEVSAVRPGFITTCKTYLRQNHVLSNCGVSGTLMLTRH